MANLNSLFTLWKFAWVAATWANTKRTGRIHTDYCVETSLIQYVQRYVLISDDDILASNSMYPNKS